MDGDPILARRARAGWRAILAGLALAVAGCGPQTPQGPPTTPPEVAAELESKPSTREWASALRTHFPGDYRSLLDRLAAAGREGGRERLARAAAIFIQDFIARKAEAMASAPDAQLDALADAWLATMRDIHSRNDPLCSMILANHIDFSRLRTDASPSPSHRQTALMILAAHAGEAGQGRRRGLPAQAELDAWIERARAIDPQVPAMLEEGAMERQTPRQRCGLLVTLLQAATELPAPVTANIVAGMLLEARGEQRPPARR